MLTSADERFHETGGLAGRSPAQVKERLLGVDALLGSWGPAIKELVAAACDDDDQEQGPGAVADVRPLYRLPVGQAWAHRRGATLVGDAAHLMCPWAGEGVNLAMWDALLLSRAIAKAHDGSAGDEDPALAFQSILDPLMAEFEIDMVARAREKAEEALSNGEMLFGEDGARAFADFFRQFGPPPE